MKAINPLMITLWVVASAIVGFSFSTWSVNNGFEIPLSGITLALSTFLIALILLVMVFPIWKYKRNLTKVVIVNQARLLPVNPFYAVRVLLIAKASAITAALFVGWHVGVLIKQFTAPVIVGEATASNLTVLVASVVLLITSFTVEHICKLPSEKKKDD